jgi:beta-galactosidase
VSVPPGGRSAPGTPGLWFGGDYNPEQWGPRVWADDDALMREAGVNTVTVGVFAWSLLEPREGTYDFAWLDATLDRLHAAGVRVVLATPTASPPPWFTLAHPDAMPVTSGGVRLTHGSRDTYCAAAPAYRAAARRIAAALAERYAGHPALALWHVHNEYGTICWCDHAAAAFRGWLARRYGPGRDGLAALNEAWGTAFWSQRYHDWDQVLPPRATQWLPNPAHALDFHRFWSDELLAAFCEQRDEIRSITDRVPITTNFVMADYHVIDTWAWSRQTDVVAVDHYLGSAGPDGHADIAFCGDRARSWGGGAPWLLMEQAANLIYARDRVLTKAPGRVLRDSLGYLARGSEGAMFFQWRASPAGAEMHHSAMVPHCGPDSRVFREVTELGRVMGQLAEVAGSTVSAQAAVVWDTECAWAMEQSRFTSADLSYSGAVRNAHGALWRAGVVCDVTRLDGCSPCGFGLGGYRLVLAPGVCLLSGEAAAALREYVAAGGHVVMWYFGAVVDAEHHAYLGGTPGGLLDVFGIRVEEWCPLPRHGSVALSFTGPDAGTADAGTADAGTADAGAADAWPPAVGTVWSERLRAEGAEVVVSYRDGPLAGLPAVTRHPHGAGVAWYVSTRLDDHTHDALLTIVLAEAGVDPVVPGLAAGVEAVRRRGDGRSWLFVLNHTDAPAAVPATGTELLSGRAVRGEIEVGPGGVAVVREPA